MRYITAMNAAILPLEDLVERIRAADPGVLAIYRFGSHGTAHQRAGSDLDLAVMGMSADPIRRLDLTGTLALQAGRDVDLVRLEDASTVMQAQIITTGEMLFCRDQRVCAEFEARVLSDYARLNRERREILADIQRHGSIHG